MPGSGTALQASDFSSRRPCPRQPLLTPAYAGPQLRLPCKLLKVLHSRQIPPFMLNSNTFDAIACALRISHVAVWFLRYRNSRTGVRNLRGGECHWTEPSPTRHTEQHHGFTNKLSPRCNTGRAHKAASAALPVRRSRRSLCRSRARPRSACRGRRRSRGAPPCSRLLQQLRTYAATNVFRDSGRGDRVAGAAGAAGVGAG